MNPIDLDDNIDVNIARGLREWRHEQACELSIPPFWIITNATMAAIAARRPTTLEDLATIPGMGKVRTEKYGGEILKIIAAATLATKAAQEAKAIPEREESNCQPFVSHNSLDMVSLETRSIRTRLTPKAARLLAYELLKAAEYIS